MGLIRSGLFQLHDLRERSLYHDEATPGGVGGQGAGMVQFRWMVVGGVENGAVERGESRSLR